MIFLSDSGQDLNMFIQSVIKSLMDKREKVNCLDLQLLTSDSKTKVHEIHTDSFDLCGFREMISFISFQG